MASGEFFTEHWKEIDDDRIARYEQMFVWRDGNKRLLEGAELADGQAVLDLGAGPGFFAMGLANLVGPTGRVAGVDLNARFVEDANSRAVGHDNIEFQRVTDHRLPFDDATFDRVICKNVLEYVPDLAATLQEVHRVLKPGGRAHVIDSDWGFVIVSPWSKVEVDEFFNAARGAFNEPFIGREAPGALGRAGFAPARVRIVAGVDQEGVLGMNVLKNMASYIRAFDALPAARLEAMMGRVQAAIDGQQYLFCLPQFLITAEKA